MVQLFVGLLFVAIALVGLNRAHEVPALGADGRYAVSTTPCVSVCSDRRPNPVCGESYDHNRLVPHRLFNNYCQLRRHNCLFRLNRKCCYKGLQNMRPNINIVFYTRRLSGRGGFGTVWWLDAAQLEIGN